ncbi:MAG: hypothetical protein ABH872_05330 [Candidatus Omnitrophota bacterium]
MYRYFIIAFISIVVFLSGCAPIELARLLGVTVKPFRECETKYSQVFDYEYFKCFGKVIEAINDMEAEVLRKDVIEGFIIGVYFNSIYKYSNDTTEVAFFFMEAGEDKTTVDVVSFNYDLAEFVSRELAKHLNPKPDI